VYDPTTKNWTNNSGPVPGLSGRFGASLVPNGRQLVLFGGVCSPAEDASVWRVTLPSTWTRDPSSSLAPNLVFHSAVVSSGSLYTFGGATPTAYATSLLHRYDLVTSNWTQINSSGPAPRQRASLVPSGTRLFLFGGTNETYYFNDVWQLILQKDCNSLACEQCSNSTTCGWCKLNSQCLAGTRNNSFLGSCTTSGTADWVIRVSMCPETGFPSWGIALIVIGGVVLIGILVFAIMKVRSKSDYSAI